MMRERHVMLTRLQANLRKEKGSPSGSAPQRLLQICRRASQMGLRRRREMPAFSASRARRLGRSAPGS